jgi:hypothetical protein
MKLCCCCESLGGEFVVDGKSIFTRRPLRNFIDIFSVCEGEKGEREKGGEKKNVRTAC